MQLKDENDRLRKRLEDVTPAMKQAFAVRHHASSRWYPLSGYNAIVKRISFLKLISAAKN